MTATLIFLIHVKDNFIFSISGAPTAMPPAQGGLSPAPAAATGPDGVPLHDETSQQSTLSQSSDRSDGRQTPKTGPGFVGPTPAQGYPASSTGPPGSPHSSAPSPGGSLGSSAGGHDSGYPRDIASPNWQRTAASPVSAPQVRILIVVIHVLIVTCFSIHPVL